MAGAHRAPTVGPEWVHLSDHLAALRGADARFAEERDRRYTETNVEREKALKIKEQADRDALALARADQTYKDERANNLRTQLERERGDYATKDDLAGLAAKVEATIKPLSEFIAGQRGGSAVWGQLAIAAGLLIAAVTLIIKL